MEKTTFVLSLFSLNESVTDKNYKTPDVKKLRNVLNQVEKLENLDPTLIEEKDHIFLNIISRIKEKIETKYQIFSSHDNNMEGKNYTLYKSWESSFRKLADAMQCIDGIGINRIQSSDWLDSDFIMEQGIRIITAGNHLEYDFHAFVNRSLEYLGKSAFLLCFDDIDTNFAKGWPVLEILRKFLTTPQLITILTGDLGLYSSLIRQQQWKNFGKELLDYEYNIGREVEKYQSVVTHLEEQYMLKLLKPERRISLNTLYQKEDTMLSEIRVISENTKKEGDLLGDFYDVGFKSLGINDGTQRKIFFQFLANLPIRTQRQLLDSIGPNKTLLEQTILDLFWSDLANKDVEVTILRDHPELMVIHILKYLIRNNILFDGFNFKPVFDNIILNGAQFAAGVMLSINTKNNPGEMFEYWLRIGFAKEIAALIKKNIFNEDKRLKDGPSLDDYLNHCSMLSKRTVRHVSRMTVSYLRGLKAWYFSTREEDTGSYEIPENSWLGTLPLDNEVHKKHPNINMLIASLNPVARIVASLPLIAVMEHKGNTMPVYSIYNLLGILGEIIETLDGLNFHVYNGQTDVDSKLKIRAQETIEIILFKDSQFRDYPLPTWSTAPIKGHLQDPMEPSDSDLSMKEYRFNDAPKVRKELSKLSESILYWYLSWYPSSGDKNDAKQLNKSYNKMIPTYLFASIFTRFFYILSRMDKNRFLSSASLGTWMHRMVVAFMHSVLIEESMEYLRPEIIDDLELDNPIDSDDRFIFNLKEIHARLIKSQGNQLKGNLDLSKWLLSCPLWYFFLKPDQHLTTALNKISIRPYNTSSLYHILNNVRIKQNKISPENVNIKKKKILPKNVRIKKIKISPENVSKKKKSISPKT